MLKNKTLVTRMAHVNNFGNIEYSDNIYHEIHSFTQAGFVSVFNEHGSIFTTLTSVFSTNNISRMYSPQFGTFVYIMNSIESSDIGQTYKNENYFRSTMRKILYRRKKKEILNK